MYRNFAYRNGGQSAANPTALEVQGDAECCAHQALETIYRRELEGLLRFLKRRVGEDLAPALAQDVFLRATTDRKSVVSGTYVSVRVDIGGRRPIKKQKKN